MKKLITVLLSLTFVVCLIGCDTKVQKSPQQAGSGHSNVKLTVDGQPQQQSDNNNPDGNAEQTTGATASTDSPSTKSPETPSASTSLSAPDIDISTVGSNLIYSKATEIASNYQSYLGKTIKIKGKYSFEKGQGRNYYYCLVSDPTACCNAGFEFVLKDTSATYPAENAEFIVQGKLNSYKEGENTYLELIDATIIK